MRLRSRYLIVAAILASCGGLAQSIRGDPARPGRQRLIIAFSSLRERPAFANLFFYRHDGIGQGELAGSVPAQFERADSHATLTADGTLCAYASKQVGGFTPLVNVWNRRENRQAPALGFNSEAGSRIEPVVSGDGRWLAACARGHVNAIGGWDVFFFELATGKEIPLAGLNSDHDEREVTMDRTGRYLAFVTNRRGGVGLSDLALYDRQTASLVPLDGVNTEHRELNPSLSGDGRFLAFVSDRPGGAGGKDIYAFDFEDRRLVDLTGLNSVAHEQTPVFSPDGRFIAFVSERTSGTGERDVFLYDCETMRLVPTPGLNSKHEDFDPSLAFEELEDAAPIK